MLVNNNSDEIGKKMMDTEGSDRTSCSLSAIYEEWSWEDFRFLVQRRLQLRVE